MKEASEQVVTAAGMRQRVEAAHDHVSLALTSIKDMAYVTGMMDLANMLTKLGSIISAGGDIGEMPGLPPPTQKLDLATVAYVTKAACAVVAQSLENVSMMGPATPEENAMSMPTDGMPN